MFCTNTFRIRSVVTYNRYCPYYCLSVTYHRISFDFFSLFSFFIQYKKSCVKFTCIFMVSYLLYNWKCPSVHKGNVNCSAANQDRWLKFSANICHIFGHPVYILFIPCWSVIHSTKVARAYLLTLMFARILQIIQTASRLLYVFGLVIIIVSSSQL